MSGPAQGPPLRRRILSLPTFISFGVAIVLVVFVLSRFDVDLAAMWQRIRGAHPGLYLLGVGVYYLGFPVRGYRWRLLVENGQSRGAPSPLPSVLSFGYFMYLGWFINAISWFRMGDAYRAYLLTTQAPLSFSRTMGSVLAERVLDLVTVSALLAVATAGLLLAGGTAATSLLIVALALVVLALAGVAGMAVLGDRLEGRLPPPFARVYRNFHEGILGSFRRLGLLVVVSILVWAIEAAHLVLMSSALGLEVAAPLLIFAALAASLLSTVPITPGGVGIVETGMTGIIMLALPQAEAISLTLLDRSASYLSVLVLGSVLFLTQQVREHRNSLERREPSLEADDG